MAFFAGTGSVTMLPSPRSSRRASRTPSRTWLGRATPPTGAHRGIGGGRRSRIDRGARHRAGDPLRAHEHERRARRAGRPGEQVHRPPIAVHDGADLGASHRVRSLDLASIAVEWGGRRLRYSMRSTPGQHRFCGCSESRSIRQGLLRMRGVPMILSAHCSHEIALSGRSKRSAGPRQQSRPWRSQMSCFVSSRLRTRLDC